MHGAAVKSNSKVTGAPSKRRVTDDLPIATPKDPAPGKRLPGTASLVFEPSQDLEDTMLTFVAHPRRLPGTWSVAAGFSLVRSWTGMLVREIEIRRDQRRL